MTLTDTSEENGANKVTLLLSGVISPMKVFLE